MAKFKRLTMSMIFKRKINIVIAAIIAIMIFLFFLQPLMDMNRYKHRVVKNDYKRFMWMLSDSVRLDNRWGNDTLLSVTGQIRETHEYFSYNLEERIYVHIFDFYDLHQLMVDEMNINYLEDFTAFKKRNISILNKDTRNFPVIFIKHKLNFTYPITFNIDSEADLNEIRNSIHSKSFFGKLTLMSISNGKNEHLVLFDFTSTSKVLITFFTFNFKFYIIIITSDHVLDESCINFLNLDQSDS